MVIGDLGGRDGIEELVVAGPGLLIADVGEHIMRQSKPPEVEPAVTPFAEQLDLPFVCDGEF